MRQDIRLKSPSWLQEQNIMSNRDDVRIIRRSLQILFMCALALIVTTLGNAYIDHIANR